MVGMYSREVFVIARSLSTQLLYFSLISVGIKSSCSYLYPTVNLILGGFPIECSATCKLVP